MPVYVAGRKRKRGGGVQKQSETYHRVSMDRLWKVAQSDPNCISDGAALRSWRVERCANDCGATVVPHAREKSPAVCSNCRAWFVGRKLVERRTAAERKAAAEERSAA